MRNFPLDQYRFKILTVERIKLGTQHLLRQHGYEFIGQICHFHDTLWVHSDYKNELNWDAFKALNSYLNTTIYDVK